MAEPARTTVASPAASARQWRLCLLLTQSACRLPWEVVLERAIAGGVDAVQVREKNLDARELVAHARAVRAVCAPRGVATIVNDRLDVALAADAD
ncbi:MAG: thiamine phosphate synthase, partial [bacterium]